jgi:hypothetical protein
LDQPQEAFECPLVPGGRLHREIVEFRLPADGSYAVVPVLLRIPFHVEFFVPGS